MERKMLPLRMAKLLLFKMLRVPRARQSRWNFGLTRGAVENGPSP
jgi:hypothetical protein